MTLLGVKSVRALAAASLAAVLGIAISVPARAQTSGASHHRGAKVRHVFSHRLPPMNGHRLTEKIVEVTYGPGDFSSPHMHPCPVVVYVLSGAVRMQVKGQPEGVYKAGQTFFEEPSHIHQVSANASKTKPAKFLAIFVCDHKTPLTIPVPGVETPKEEGTGSR